jgi:hypothetical protein
MVSIEKLHEKSVNLRKWVEDLVLFFKERSLIEDLYSKDLERLSQKLSPSPFPEFSEVLKSIILEVSSSASKLAASISENLGNSLSKVISTQASLIRESFIEGSKTERRKSRLTQKVQEAKSKYWECCCQCEQVAVALDNETSLNKKEKLLNRLLSSKSSLDTLYKNYVESIEKYNRYRKTFQAKTKKFVVSFQLQEQEIVDNLNIDLKEFSLLETGEGIKDEKIFLRVSNEDFSLFFKYPECYFEAYEGSHPLFKNIGIHSAPHLHASIMEVAAFDLGTSSAVESLYRTEVGIIVSKAWEGNDLNPQEYLQFNAIIKEHLGRKAWSWTMNQKRTQGIFKLENKGFSLVSELMVAVLNECERCQDITIAKNCIILSQTFYQLAESGKNYLQNAILSHTLWEKSEFWEKVVRSAIADEIKNQRKDDLNSEHLKSLVFCQMVSFGNIMMSFKVHEDVISTLFQEISKVYNFNEQEVLEVMVINT